MKTKTREVGVVETERERKEGGRREETRGEGSKKETEKEKLEKGESDKHKLSGRRMENLG